MRLIAFWNVNREKTIAVELTPHSKVFETISISFKDSSPNSWYNLSQWASNSTSYSKCKLILYWFYFIIKGNAIWLVINILFIGHIIKDDIPLITLLNCSWVNHFLCLLTSIKIEAHFPLNFPFVYLIQTVI